MSYEVMDKNRIPEYARAWQELLNYSVEIGIFQNSGQHEDRTSILLIANVHEFGCNIRVTPRMRAYLHSQGLHLKKDTRHINIPERSFVRSGFDSKKKDMERKAINLLKQAMTLNIGAKDLFEALGTMIVEDLKAYIPSEEFRSAVPPLHPFTLGRKAPKTQPLIDSGKLRTAITHRVVKR